LAAAGILSLRPATLSPTSERYPATEHLILLLLAGLILASTVWGSKKSRLEEPGYSDH
jgi:hypothetical protein